MNSTAGLIRRYLPWVVLAALVGGVTFILAQRLEGFPQHIAAFMGGQIVSQGGYPGWMAGPLGWGVHFGVSLTYAALFAILTHVPGYPRAWTIRWGLGLALAFVLGKLTTLATAPAIAVTIGLLSGQGLPESLPGWNTALGWPFWNHVFFFGVCWILTLVTPDIVRPQARAS